MGTVATYSALLDRMIGHRATDPQTSWKLEGNFDTEIGVVLAKRMQNLTVSVKSTSTVPPVQSVPSSTVTSRPVTPVDVAQSPVSQTTSDVPVSQPNGGWQDAPADVLDWSKQDVKTVLSGAWPVAKKPRTSGHKVGNADLLSYWYPLRETTAASAYLVKFKEGDKFVVVTTETPLTASNVQSEGGLNAVQTKFDEWVASSEPISFYQPSNNASNANKGLVLIK